MSDDHCLQSMPYCLVDTLSDGRFVSGQELGARHCVSRQAIWGAVQQLRALGLPIDAVRGKGYRLSGGLQMLNADAIRSYFDPVVAKIYSRLHILTMVDSTNRYVLDCAQKGQGAGLICLAEGQTAGRGRRGRTWVSPFACNIYLSLLSQFSHQPPSKLGGLSLALGLAVVSVLKALGIDCVGVKWPNDIVTNKGEKLGGILIEVHSEISGPSQCVIGLGLNVNMPKGVASDSIKQPFTSVARLTGQRVSRDALAGRLINALGLALTGFIQKGFKPFVDEWRMYDVLCGREVCIQQGARSLTGVAMGVNEGGELLIQVNNQLIAFCSGEVSVRALNTVI